MTSIMNRITIGVCILAGVFAGRAPAQDAVSPGMTAAQIIAQMEEAYATCTTYTDSGEIHKTFHRDGRVKIIRFETAFIRPDRFRFEFNQADRHNPEGPRQRYIVWQDGRHVRRWSYAREQVNRKATLSLAIAGATGVSSGVAHYVPRLMIPEIDGGSVTDGRFTRIDDVTLAIDATGESVDCYRLVGSEFELWIGTQDFLLRRVIRDSGMSNRVVTYRPTINDAVAESALAFNHPGGDDRLILVALLCAGGAFACVLLFYRRRRRT